jgi:hypothetical protein
VPRRNLFAEPVEADVVLPHNFRPRAHQRGVLRHFKRGGLRYSGVWHRRAGKDRVMFVLLSLLAHLRIGTYWHCLPTLKQARKVIWDNITRDGQRLVEATFPREIVSRVREDDMRIELRCGSIVQLMGADNIESNLGANPLHITFSEFALTDPNAWTFTRPILLENGGTAAFITTPRGYNHAYETHEIAKRSKGWLAETFGIHDTGLVTLEQYRQEIDQGMPEELARQEYLCDFSAANVGSVLGRYVELAERERRIDEAIAYDPAAELHVVSDIGFRDASAWWFVQPLPGGFHVVRYEEDRGMDADDWIGRLKEIALVEGYTYTRIWLPHDARVKTFQSRRSALEAFLAAFGAEVMRITPKTSVADYINAGRALLKRAAFSRSACERGLRMLRDWHFAWDDEAKVFSREPEHDYASHGGEAWCYCGVNLAEARVAVVPPVPPLAVPVHNAFHLEQLYEAREQANRRRF